MRARRPDAPLWWARLLSRHGTGLRDGVASRDVAQESAGGTVSGGHLLGQVATPPDAAATRSRPGEARRHRWGLLAPFSDPSLSASTRAGPNLSGSALILPAGSPSTPRHGCGAVGRRTGRRVRPCAREPAWRHPAHGRARGQSEGRLKIVVSPVRIWVPPSADPASLFGLSAFCAPRARRLSRPRSAASWTSPSRPSGPAPTISPPARPRMRSEPAALAPRTRRRRGDGGAPPRGGSAGSLLRPATLRTPVASKKVGATDGVPRSHVERLTPTTSCGRIVPSMISSAMSAKRLCSERAKRRSLANASSTLMPTLWATIPFACSIASRL